MISLETGDWKRGSDKRALREKYILLKIQLLMAVQDLKWYSTFEFLIGSILSFADPITDVLALMEFYNENHRSWFKWGVIFMIVPCLTFVMVYLLTITFDNVRGVTDFLRRVLFTLNPFSPGWATLKAFVLCLKNFKTLWRGEEVDCGDDVDDVNRLLTYVNFAPFMEVITESIPQFIIQLYVASVQEKPVKIIQIISLLVSFLSLVWSFSAADGFLHEGEIDMKIKHKFIFLVTNSFLLSSRLFAICYFIMAFRGWIFVVLILHSVIVALADSCRRYKAGRKCDWRCSAIFIFFLFSHWIREDLSAPHDADDSGSRKKQLKRIQWLSNVMFVVENIVMIILFYNHSKYSNAWYTLPLTVSVCSLTILGATIRLIHFNSLLKNRVTPEEVEAVGLAIQQELLKIFDMVPPAARKS